MTNQLYPTVKWFAWRPVRLGPFGRQGWTWLKYVKKGVVQAFGMRLTEYFPLKN